MAPGCGTAFSGERGGAEMMLGVNLLRDLRPFSLPPQLSLTLQDDIDTPQRSQYRDIII